MDPTQMATQCREMMAGQSAQGGDAAGMREQCWQMAAMCGGGEAAGRLKRCEQMAARFSGQDETGEEPEQGEPQAQQFA